MPCCKCEHGESFYCIDCEDVYCHACADRIHQEGDAEHSLEQIVNADEKGVPILTMLADEIIVCTVFYFVFTRTHIEKDYFQVNASCPFVTRGQRMIAGMDAGANALLQSSMFEACSIEHSFWRFYSDTWVRSIVTGTDSMLVLLANAFHVLFSDVVLVTFMIPAVSLAYALLFWILHLVETSLPKTPTLQLLERWSRSLNVVDFFDDIPPVTLPRSRDALDLWDQFTYPFLRLTRVPHYYYGRISQRLQTLLMWSMIFVVTVRLTVIIFGISALVIIAILATLLVGICANMIELWPLNRPGSWKFVLVAVGALLAVAPAKYREHKAFFAHVKEGRSFSDKVFWQALLEVLRVDEAGFQKMLLALLGIALTIGVGFICCAGICKRRFKKSLD